MRVAVSLLHLNKKHHGLVVGRDLAPDIRQALALTPIPVRTTTPPLEQPSESERLMPSTRPTEKVQAPQSAANKEMVRKSAAVAAEGVAPPPLEEEISVAHDLRLSANAMGLLVGEWRAPLRCRPYTRLEHLANQPEVHAGDEEYWRTKRRSVVPPKVGWCS